MTRLVAFAFIVFLKCGFGRVINVAWMIPETHEILNGSSSVGTLAYVLHRIEERGILPGTSINPCIYRIPDVWFRQSYKCGLDDTKKTHEILNGSSSVGTLAYVLHRIEERGILPGTSINVTWIDSACDSKLSIGRLTDLLFTSSIDVILGPPCTDAMVPVAELAAYRDIAVFGWVSNSFELNNKTRFSTLIRVFPPTSSIGKVFVAFCEEMKWRIVAMLSTSLSMNAKLAQTMLYTFGPAIDDNVTIVRHYQISADASSNKIRSYFVKLKKEARVIFLIIPRTLVRKYMLIAHGLDMTAGDFQFLFAEQTVPKHSDLERFQEGQLWKSGDGQNEAARQSFKNLLYFTFSSVLEYEVIQTETAEMYKRVFGGRQDIPPYSPKRDEFSSFLFDAMYLCASSLNITLQRNSTKGLDIFNVSTGTWKPLNGLTGDINIDHDGDRLPSFVVLDMDSEGHFTPTYNVVMTIANGQLKSNVSRVAPVLWGNGQNSHNFIPPDTPECGFEYERCPQDKGFTVQVALVSTLAVVMMVFVIGSFVLYRWWRYAHDSGNWKISYNDLEFNLRRKRKRSSLSKASKRKRSKQNKSDIQRSSDDVDDLDNSSAQASTTSSLNEGSALLDHYTPVAFYQGNLVSVKKIWKRKISLDSKLQNHMKQMLQLKHVNLVSFVGVCPQHPNISVVWEYCTKGSLKDILENSSMKLDSMFQFSIAMDICNGLNYLHESSLKVHGNLKSSNCLVDNRWVCKLTDFGLRPIRKGCNNTQEIKEEDHYADFYWLAPELLRSQLTAKSYKPTQPGDIYALAIVLKELLCLNKPYTEETRLTPKEIIHRVANRPPNTLMRPLILEVLDEYIGLRKPFIQLIQHCWGEDPQARPSIRRVLKRMTRINPYRSSSMMDNMIVMMERYSDHLEELVTERTAQLQEEKRKTDALLYSMLPQKVADNLKSGQLVQAEAFEQASVFFSDIVGFTDLASESTPMEIVEMLNALYTMFDDTIRSYDVYKVETIGDAYMIVSGVPVANGDRHVQEIADTSLSLLKRVMDFVIPHRPDRQLNIRIGLHTGPVVAGVVGLTMPRYCLFGDTVNMGARMESNGLPLNIHVSSSTAELLRKVPQYNVTERGYITVKGKGQVRTFWLLGKLGFFQVPVSDVFCNYVASPKDLRDLAKEATVEAEVSNDANTNTSVTNTDPEISKQV